MQIYKRLSLALAVLLLIVSVVACQPAKRPGEKGIVPKKVEEKNIKKPPIPESISQGEGKEPRLKVYLTEGQKINEMKFEDYVVGVLAGEMSNDFPEEALEAQAILARTFVMEFITEKGESKYKGAHVSTDIEEAQAWNSKEINERIIKAVSNTRGQVLLYDGKYVKSWFYAHAGGKTATAKEGLGYTEAEPPYIQVVKSPDSPEAPPEDANWTATFTKGQINEAMQKVGKTPGDFNSIEIVKKGPSGRATELKIGNETVQAPRFRLAIDSTKMKSTKLESIKVEGDKVTMKGTGYGHGVGMSQWGAYKMAKDGKKAEDIIKHYFKGVQIVKLWE
ncbi:SpoIID/LytB domain-containing protein [Alkaliphilus sp. B6464]|uniref:SpoIID/LytB domain-containing protein n=1 Tax=Alkaliphilus sp. B6464 TaxID=2731219 RepID=UPI001BAA89B8|nr:SpoIID/LytB domain-containing protein [Alkaliphilus sp. B6464]